MLGQSAVPVLLLIVHGHVCPIGGSGCRGRGPPRLPILLWGSAGPSGEVEVRRGCQAFDDVMGPRARQKPLPETPISPETFLQGSGGMEVDFLASSD
jgi:hypothetical protein